MGPEHLFTSGTIMDLGNNCREAEANWGAHVIGSIFAAKKKIDTMSYCLKILFYT
jgi:hypothetical protein